MRDRGVRMISVGKAKFGGHHGKVEACFRLIDGKHKYRVISDGALQCFIDKVIRQATCPPVGNEPLTWEDIQEYLKRSE